MTITAQEIQSYKTYNACKELRCPYVNGPFKLYKDMSSKRKGKAFEMLFEEYMTLKGYKKLKNYNSGHDRVFVDSTGKEVKYEIKGSTLWGERGEDGLRWQQIRPDQDYDQIVFVAVLPDRIDFYWATKEEVSAYVNVQNEKGEWPHNQHGGKKVRSGTFFIHGMPNDFPFMKSL